MKNIESEGKDEGVHPFDIGNHERLKPVNKYLEPSKQSGDDKGIQSQQAHDRDSLPFPIFWLPYKNSEVEKDSKENKSLQVTSNQLPSFASDDKKRQSKRDEESSGGKPDYRAMDKNPVQKAIPVKQKETREGSQKKANSETVENADNAGEVKHSEDTRPQKPSSPKSSKLPPVCLRVDPLPRKKNGNGSSRSPSPPTTKGKIKEPTTNNTVCLSQQPSLEEKSSRQQMQSQGSLNKGKEVEQDKSNIKIIDVMDAATEKHKQDLEQRKKQSFVCSSESPSVSQSIDSTSDTLEGKLAELSMGDIGKSINVEKEGINEGNKAERKISEQEAAMIIQSAYRGFEVRKSQPLKKLRQIAEVNKQIVEINSRIRDLESSPDIHDKQKVVIGETIMSLLLKLDTIQGLHPMVRDIRKSVAKELVCLQEKLDILASRKSEALGEGASSMELLETSIVDSEDAAIKAAVDEAHAESDDSEAVEFDSSLADKRHGPEASEPSMPLLADMGICKMGENEVKEAQNDATVPAYHLDLEPHEEMKNQEINKEIDPAEPPMSKETEQFVELPLFLVAEDNTSSVDKVAKDDNANKMEDLPTVPDESLDLQEAATGNVNATASVDDFKVDTEVSVKEGAINEELEDYSKKEENVGKDDKSLEEAGLEQQEIFLESQEAKAVVVDKVEEVEVEEVKAVSDRKGEAHEGVDGGEMEEQEKGENARKEVRLEPRTPELEAVHIRPVEGVQQLEEVMPKSHRERDAAHDEMFVLKDVYGPTVQRGSLDIEEAKESSKNETFGEECKASGTKNVVNARELMEDETEVCQEPPKLNSDEGQESPIDEPKNVPTEEKIGTEQDQQESRHLSPAESKIPTDNDRKLVEENERLKEMMENLIKAGNKQLATICKLSGRVKDLEKKLSRKKKMKLRRCKTHASNLRDELRACQV